MTNTAVLEDYINRSGLKKNRIAAALGLTSYGLSLKVRNVNEFKASEIDLLCAILQIDLSDRMRIFFAKDVAK